MLQSTKFTQSPTQSRLFHRHTLQPNDIPQNQNIPTPPTPFSPLILKQCDSKFTRRELTLFTNSSLLLFFASQTLDPNLISRARAEETPPASTDESDQEEAEEASPKTASDRCTDKTLTGKAFLDVSIDGEPVGRIVIGLNGESAPKGAARFRDIVSGKTGITFKRKEFVRIMQNYVQHGGIRSYGVDAELARQKGRELTNDELVEEWERLNKECKGIKNTAGSVGIIVRDPSKPPPKIKLVARKGKLEIDQEEVGVEPNGTEFTIAMKDSPELDSSALVVGRVIEGMDVVEKIGKVKTVQENTGSPYFRVAKLIGDKRAVVAERGFNRPYSKVIVTNCGLLE